MNIIGLTTQDGSYLDRLFFSIAWRFSDFISLLIRCNHFGRKSTALFMSFVEHTKFPISFFNETLTWHFAAVEWRNYNSSRTSHKRCKMLKTRVNVAQSAQIQIRVSRSHGVENIRTSRCSVKCRNTESSPIQQVRMPFKRSSLLLTNTETFHFLEGEENSEWKVGSFWAKPTQYFLSSYHKHNL